MLVATAAPAAAEVLELRVEADLSTSPFYVGGTIFEETGADPIGQFQCRGWMLEDGSLTLVSQEWDIAGR